MSRSALLVFQNSWRSRLKGAGGAAGGRLAEMDGGEVEAGDVEMAVTEGGMDALAGTAAAAASADLAMPVPTTAAPVGNVRAARADKDFAGWVS